MRRVFDTPIGNSFGRGMQVNLFLVRHGLSIANTQGLVTGDIHDLLSTEGMDDLQKLVTWYKELTLPIEVAYTSQWRRAQQTASELFATQEFNIDARLGEACAGIVANWTLGDFLQLWPDFYNSPHNCYPGGESHIQLNNRVMDWLEWIYANHTGQNVLVVCHSGPIACLVQQALRIPMDRFPALLPDHCSLTIIQYKDRAQVLPVGKLRIFSTTSAPRLASVYRRGYTP